MLSSILVSIGLMLASAVASPVPQDSTATTDSYSNNTFCQIKPATPLEQKARFEDFVYKLFIQKDVNAAYHTYVVENLIEHDATTPNGAQASIDGLNAILPPATLTIYHKTFEFLNSTGWVHTRFSGGTFGNETAIADLYRFDGSCIVEHWDVIQKRMPGDRPLF